MTSKWQVTIPGEIRMARDVQVGERLAWDVRDGLLTARRLPRLSSLAGCLGAPVGPWCGGAVTCYFDDPFTAPAVFRLHFVRDEVLAR